MHSKLHYGTLLCARTPNGIRTRAAALKGRCPRPLDDEGARRRETTGKSRGWPGGGDTGFVRIDLNCDLGEGFGNDLGLLDVVTSANVACGFHAGDAVTMDRVVRAAAERGVAVGAQVSYADRPNFGRVATDVAYEILREQVAHQVGVLSDIAAAAGASVRYLKPHGALYHRVLDDEEQAAAVLDASWSLPVLSMPGALARLAVVAGRRALTEGFPDRAYDGGRLRPRSEPGAVLDDVAQIAAHALRLAAHVDSVCVHGDSPHALAHAVTVRRALEAAGWALRGFGAR